MHKEIRKNEFEFIDSMLRLSNATFPNTFDICVISMPHYSVHQFSNKEFMNIYEE